MVINTVLFLATLFTATNQLPHSYHMKYVLREDSYAVTPHCPYAKDFWKPSNDMLKESSGTICLCEGNFAWWPLTLFNEGEHHVCLTSPQDFEIKTSLDKYARDYILENFLLCWEKKNNATIARIPEYHIHLFSFGYGWGDPLIKKKYSHIIKKFKTDPRCNGALMQKPQCSKQGVCKKQTHLVQFFKKHKKGCR